MLATTALDSHRAVLILYVAFISSLITQTHALAISYCSPQNNAGSYPGYYDEFMSNGLCQDRCQGSFSFAVLQGYYCWCSNYIPGGQESTYNCNQVCPGFGSEWCGSTDAGLYGYYLLDQGVPLGTSQGTTGNTAPSTSFSSVSTSLTGSGPVSSSSDVRTTLSPSSPAVVTVGSSQSADEASLATSSSSTVSSSATSLSSRSSSDPATTSSPSPTEVYTSVTTVTGEVRTVVVTPTPSADATLGQSSTGGGKGVNTGKVVGIVLGVILGIGAIIGIGVWLWFRRRRRNMADPSRPASSFIARTGDTSPSNIVPSRQVSQLSSSGLLGSKTPRINTLGMPLGNDPRSADTSSSGFDRRSLATDQRLNPYALYIHDESRLSDVSLQDNQDYSRQLRVANPDH